MCGITGIYGINGLSKEDLEAFQQILVNCESRGRDAFGYYAYPNMDLFKTKGSVTNYLIKHKNMYKKWDKSNMILAHTRATTVGDEKKNQNNHPFETDDFVLAHNGCISNHNTFNVKSNIETDSYIIIKNIQDEFDKNKDVITSIKNTCEKLEGSYACWILHKKSGLLYLFRHNNPIEIRYDSERKIVIFASEGGMLAPLYKPTLIKGFFKMLSYGTIKEHMIYLINKEGHLLETEEFKANSYYSTEYANYGGVKYSDTSVVVSKKDNLDSEDLTNTQIEERVFKRTGYNFSSLQKELEYFGIQLSIKNGRILLYFASDETYNKYKGVFESYGYTISPTTRTLSVSNIQKLSEIEEIVVEQGEDDMEYIVREEYGDFSGVEKTWTK